MSIEMTQDYLKSRLSYDPETGDFIWLTGKYPGTIAGSYDKNGYLVIRINERNYFSHRLAWLYVNGQFPFADIDHANKIKTDNRIVNLRDCSRTENNWNIGIKKNNTSGFKGASWSKSKQRWVAQISINNRTTYIGLFSTVEQASAAYEAKAKKLHGEFYREKK